MVNILIVSIQMNVHPAAQVRAGNVFPKAVENREQCGFALPRGSHHGGDGQGRNVQREVVQDRIFFVSKRQVADFDFHIAGWGHVTLHISVHRKADDPPIDA